MSQTAPTPAAPTHTVATHAAPTRTVATHAVTTRAVTTRAVRDEPTTRESSPFVRRRQGSVAGWFAGLVFGLVCLGTGFVVVVGFAVLGAVLAVGYVAGRATIRPVRGRAPKTLVAARSCVLP